MVKLLSIHRLAPSIIRREDAGHIIRRIDAMPVTLTERAAGEVKRIIADKRMPETTALRVAVAGGGCSGFEYKLDFQAEPAGDDDQVSQSHGVRVLVDRKSLKFLNGMEIDINEGLNKRGFVFNNPLAVRTCGCGTSFGV
jgi:iron-sulfur cluster assembly protein